MTPALVPWDYRWTPDDHHARLVLLLIRPLSQDLPQTLLIGCLAPSLPVQSSTACQQSVETDVAAIDVSIFDPIYKCNHIAEADAGAASMHVRSCNMIS